MIASIPTRFPLSEVSVPRAEIVGDDGEVAHLKKPAYHKSPEGIPSLVFTDFGADLHERLTRVGFDVRMRRPNLQLQRAVCDLVVVGYRHSGGPADRVR